MTILNESGVPDVLSPLFAVGPLAERLPDALIVVVGTRLETYLSRTLPADLSPSGRVSNNPRIFSVLLDQEDPPKQGQLASHLSEFVKDLPSISLILLVSGQSAELLGLEAEFEAHLASRSLGIPVKVVSPDANSPGCLCTDLEDRVLAGLIESCPQLTSRSVSSDSLSNKRGGFLSRLSQRRTSPSDEETPKSLVLLGSLSTASINGLAGDLTQAGLEISGSLPGANATELPALGEGTVVAAPDPHLSVATRTAEARGARVVRTLMPIGVDGTSKFIQDVSAAVDQESDQSERAQEMWQRLERLRSRIRGKRIFLAGDTGIEISLARFLANAGAVVLEVGAPRLDRRSLGPEIQALGADVDVVESPDWRGQMKRIDESRPDLVIASPGLYVPLVARGHLCRSSLDIIKAGVHGYEGARRILELLSRTFERADTLDSVHL